MAGQQDDEVESRMNGLGGRWQPIATDALAEQAQEAIDAIATELRADPFPAPDQLDRSSDRSAHRAARYASLALGRVGPALFFAYLDRTRSANGLRKLAQALLTEAATSTPGTESDGSLHFGTAGIAWTASHLGVNLLTAGGDDLGHIVDAHVQSHLEAATGWEMFDLVCGLVGLGVYALERLPAPEAVVSLGRVIGRLDDLAERQGAGMTWTSIPSLMPPRHRKAPSDYYDLGVAHGVPGVVGLLARACAAGVAVDIARPLLDGAVRWLLAQQLPTGAGSRFPLWIVPGTKPPATDLAWCYGELGIAAMLLMAAHCVAEPSWEREALALARAAAERTNDSPAFRDAQLCHGAAGVGHLFNRMFQATGEPWLKRAALQSFGCTLALRRPGEKLAGFSALGRPRAGTVPRVAHRGLLHGAAGIGLALLAATSSVEPAWDRVLLLG